MKKFTLLIFAFVCAIGFSQRSATSLSDADSSINAQDQVEKVIAPNTQDNVPMMERALVSSVITPENYSNLIYSNFNMPSDATSSECINGEATAPGIVTVSTGNYNGTSYSNNMLALAYESGPYFNIPGPPDASRLENTTLGMSTLGFGAQAPLGNRMGDDVILADDYDITSVDVFAYQTNETPPTITEVYLQVWDDDPSAGGTVIWGDLVTNVMASAIWSGAYRDTETTVGATNRAINRVTINPVGLSLPAGTYWFDWSFAGSGASGPWAPPVAILGTSATGNGQQFLASSGLWGPAIDAGTGDQQGIPIQVYGDCTSCGGGGGACSENNPGNAFENGFFTDTTGPQLIATDITIGADDNMDLESVNANIWLQPGDSVLSADIVIYNDLGGNPNTGSVVDSQLGIIPSSQSLLGSNFGWDIFDVVFDFPVASGLAGQAGIPTTYWISIYVTTTLTGQAAWGASSASQVGNTSRWSPDLGITWNDNAPFDQVYTFSGQCTGGGGGGGGPCASAILEVDQSIENTCMANISQTDLAQSYIPLEPVSAGAGIKFIAASSGLDVTLSLWDNLPNAGGTMLAIGTTPTANDVWTDVYWDPVVNVTPGNTYYIVIEGDLALPCIAGDTSNPYPGGMVFANAGYIPFPNFDYTFRTYSCDGGGSTCTSTPYVSTAVPFDIDGAGTSTADCVGAPNLVPVTVGDAGTIGTDADIENVTIDITHTWSGDLEIYLVAPSGTELLMWDNVGGSGDNFTNTQFEDGGIPTAGSSAPHTGVYQPVGGDFATTFAGEDITGDWQLKICDTAGGDTGTVDSFTLTLCITPALDNDDCASATAVACGDTVLGDTSNNTDQGGFNGAPDEWFSFTGTGTPEFVTISLCDGGTTYDSRLTVYDACGGNEILTNDDFCGLQSELTFTSDGVSTYYIAVEGFNAASSGPFSLAVTCALIPPPPPNDECANAIEVNCGDFVSGTTNDATIDDAVAPLCDTGVTSPGVWYVLNDTSGLVTDITITMCTGTTTYDSKLSVYTGDCGAPPLTCVVGNDDTCGLQSEVSFQSDGNTTFYILVHGFGGATGDFELDIQCTPVPPPNDDIANSIDIDEIGCPFTDPAVAMPAATVEGGNPVDCNIDGANGVWYNITPAGDGEITATVVTPAGATFVNFFTAPDENAQVTDLVLVDWWDNQCAPATSTTVPVVAGQAYYIFVVNTGGITDIVIECDILGVDDNAIAGFSYYPNPADDAINLQSVDMIDHVAIFNMLGQKVVDLNIEATNSQVSISHLATGTYVMKVTVNGQVGTYKVIKK